MLRQCLVDAGTLATSYGHMKSFPLRRKSSCRSVQGEMLSKEIPCIETKPSVSKDKPLWMLNPFMGEDGLTRTGGRLRNSMLDHSEWHPIVIPRQHHTATLLVQHYHERVQHNAVTLLKELSERQDCGFREQKVASAC